MICPQWSRKRFTQEFFAVGIDDGVTTRKILENLTGETAGMASASGWLDCSNPRINQTVYAKDVFDRRITTMLTPKRMKNTMTGSPANNQYIKAFGG